MDSGGAHGDTERVSQALETAELLRMIHRRDGYVVLCTKHPRWRETAVCIDVINGPNLISFLGIKDCYFTINTMRDTRRMNTSAAYLNAVYADLDGPNKEAVLDFADVQRDIRAREEAGELPRISFLVDSGRGVWVIILLQNEDGGPEIATEENRRRQEEINRPLASRLANWGADTAVFDAARVIRLPGSINRGTGRPVIYYPQYDANGLIPTSTLAELMSFFHLEEAVNLLRIRPLAAAASASAQVACSPVASLNEPFPIPVPTKRETPAKAEKAIPDGGRNVTLFRFACALRGQGVAPEEIREVTLQRNQRLCKPPKPTWEVKRLTESALRYPPGSPERRKIPWFPLSPQQFLSATHPWRVMTPVQRGWYFQLLLECWTNYGLLPPDPAVLWKLASADSQAQFDAESGVILQDFEEFEMNGQIYLVSLTLESACAEICPKFEQKRINGMRGGRPKTKNTST